MDYAEMTDFEINCAVAITLGMSHAFFFPKSEDDFCEGIEPKDRGPIWQSGKYEVKGYRVSNGNCFNPCNSWADAGPIIERKRISIEFDGDDTAQWCHTISCEGLYGIEYQANPLRAAMITFLLMQEAVNA